MANTESTDQTSLEVLLRKQEKLKQQIKLAKKIENEKVRKLQTKKFSIVGEIILDYIKQNGEFSDQILNIIHSNIKTETDRKILNFPTPNNTEQL